MRPLLFCPTIRPVKLSLSHALSLCFACYSPVFPFQWTCSQLSLFLFKFRPRRENRGPRAPKKIYKSSWKIFVGGKRSDVMCCKNTNCGCHVIILYPKSDIRWTLFWKKRAALFKYT
jgi:hypothetical protein